MTDAVMAEMTDWQARPLEPLDPVVFFDALRVKIRKDAVVRSKAVYLALGMPPDLGTCPPPLGPMQSGMPLELLRENRHDAGSLLTEKD